MTTTFIADLFVGIFIGAMIISLCKCMSDTSIKERRINEE